MNLFKKHSKEVTLDHSGQKLNIQCLGLFISKLIASKFGGNISLKS
jgi:hypothetical protein